MWITHTLVTHNTNGKKLDLEIKKFSVCLTAKMLAVEKVNDKPVEVAEKQDPHPAPTFPALWAVLPVAQAHVGQAPHS